MRSMKVLVIVTIMMLLGTTTARSGEPINSMMIYGGGGYEGINYATPFEDGYLACGYSTSIDGSFSKFGLQPSDYNNGWVFFTSAEGNVEWHYLLSNESSYCEFNTIYPAGELVRIVGEVLGTDSDRLLGLVLNKDGEKKQEIQFPRHTSYAAPVKNGFMFISQETKTFASYVSDSGEEQWRLSADILSGTHILSSHLSDDSIFLCGSKDDAEHSKRQGFACEITLDGEVLWTSVIDVADVTVLSSITTIDGKAFVVGQTIPTNAPTMGLVMALSDTGNILWRKDFDFANGAAFYDVKKLNDNLVILGHSNLTNFSIDGKKNCEILLLDNYGETLKEYTVDVNAKGILDVSYDRITIYGSEVEREEWKTTGVDDGFIATVHLDFNN